MEILQEIPGAFYKYFNEIEYEEVAIFAIIIKNFSAQIVLHIHIWRQLFFSRSQIDWFIAAVFFQGQLLQSLAANAHKYVDPPMIDGHLAYKLTPELLLVHCRPSSANFQRFSTPPQTQKKKDITKKVTKKEDAFWPISNEADFQLGKNLAANQKQKQANETTTEFGRRCDRDFECE